jgi:hypothetical protein
MNTLKAERWQMGVQRTLPAITGGIRRNTCSAETRLSKGYLNQRLDESKSGGDKGELPSYFWLRNAKWVRLILFQRGFVDVVCMQIQHQPDRNDDRKKDEASAVLDSGEDGQQENPEDQVVGLADQCKWMEEGLVDTDMIRRVISEPCEPHVGMTFEDQSVQHPDDRKTNQSAPRRP